MCARVCACARVSEEGAGGGAQRSEGGPRELVPGTFAPGLQRDFFKGRRIPELLKCPGGQFQDPPRGALARGPGDVLCPGVSCVSYFAATVPAPPPPPSPPSLEWLLSTPTPRHLPPRRSAAETRPWLSTSQRQTKMFNTSEPAAPRQSRPLPFFSPLSLRRVWSRSPERGRRRRRSAPLLPPL